MAKAQSKTAPLRFCEPDIVYRKGRPIAVLLDIKEYRRLLEIAENQHDLQRLAELERQPQRYRDFDEYLAEVESREAGTK